MATECSVLGSKYEYFLIGIGRIYGTGTMYRDRMPYSTADLTAHRMPCTVMLYLGKGTVLCMRDITL